MGTRQKPINKIRINSTRLPEEFETWSEFHDDALSILTREGRKPEYVETFTYVVWYWPGLDKEPYITETPFSLRFIERQVMAEYKDDTRLATFNVEELETLFYAITYARSCLTDKPQPDELVTMAKRIRELLKIERKKNEKRNTIRQARL